MNAIQFCIDGTINKLWLNWPLIFEMMMNGFNFFHDKRLVTVFTASSYYPDRVSDTSGSGTGSSGCGSGFLHSSFIQRQFLVIDWKIPVLEFPAPAGHLIPGSLLQANNGVVMYINREGRCGFKILTPQEEKGEGRGDSTGQEKGGGVGAGGAALESRNRRSVLMWAS